MTHRFKREKELPGHHRCEMCGLLVYWFENTGQGRVSGITEQISEAEEFRDTPADSVSCTDLVIKGIIQ